MLNSIKKLFLITFISYTTSIFAQSQNLKFRHLTVEDGLSHGWIRCIYKDSFGFMWFGTGNNGVNKYDGSNFTIYENEPGNKNTLSNNSINFIHEDKNRNLLISTDLGLNVYNRKLDIMIPVPSLNNTYINDIFELDNGKYILATEDNLILFDTKNDSLITLDNLNGNFSFRFIKDGIVNYNNKLLMGTNQGLFYFDTSIYKLTPIIPNITIRTILIDKNNRIWYGTQSKGLFCITLKDNDLSKSVIKNFVHIPDNINSISNSSIEALQTDNNNNLWIGTENDGLNILNLDNLNEDDIVFQHYRNDPSDIFSIAGNSINTIYMDNEGTVWISTYNSGISYYNKLLFKFNHVKHNESNINSINDNQVNAIYKEDNYLWIGTQKGLSVQNLQTKKWEHFEYDQGNNKSLGGGVCAIFRDSRNNMWIGTWAGGLNLFNETTKSFTRFLHDPDDESSLSNNNIFDIKEDENGMIWIATIGGGLNKFDYKTNSFKSYLNNPDPANRTQRYIGALIIDKSDIYIAGSNGLEIFNIEKEEGLQFENDQANPKSISSNGTIYAFKDSKRNIWVGTTNGLNLFNRDSANFKLYNKKDGLPSNVIHAICEDDHGNLWISTNKGISEFVNGINCPKSPVFENFDREDGLQGNTFNDRSFFKSKDGKLYFGGPNGFNVFHPDSIKKNPHLPGLVFTNLLIFNKPVKIGEEKSPLTKHISLTEELTFNHHQSVITIEYAAVNYLAPDKTQYAYIMEGFEEEWNYVGNKREATYTNLDPGTYTFRVKGSNNDGVWNEEGTSLKIIITPPFWKTFWFRLLIILLTIIMLYIIYKLRMMSIHKINRELEDHVAKRTKELKMINQELESFTYSVSHDLRTPLRGMSGFSEILIEEYADKLDEKAQHYLHRIYDAGIHMNVLIDDILKLSRIARNKLVMERVDLSSIVESIVADLKQKDPDRKVKVNITKSLVVRGDKALLTIMLENLLGNAWKFTSRKPETMIEFGKTFYNNHQVFFLKDNGIGFDNEFAAKIFEAFHRLQSDFEGTGIGLATVQRIISRHHGKIWAESELGKKTIFYFTFPEQ